MDAGEQPMLRCRGIVKRFSNNAVLKGVDLQVKRGEVHAVLGANGAGKSTLVKIITGVYTHDEGDISLDGKSACFSSALESEAAGIAIIHQDPPLVPSFDVTRNAFLGSELRNRFGLLDFKAMRDAAAAMLEDLNADFGPDRLIKTLNLSEREQVAIVSALLKKPKLLILDEPTATLSDREITRLFEIVRRLRDKGVTIIYISHLLDEIFQISDSITVLRDGMNAGTLKTSAAEKADIIHLMTGRKIGRLYPKEFVERGGVLLRADRLRFAGGSDEGVSFEVRAGEIVGFAGLVGAGRTEVMMALYGAAKALSGQVELCGSPYRPVSPVKAREKGFAFIPEDRRNEGLVMSMSIRENVSLANMSAWSGWGVIDRKREKQIASGVCATLDVASTGTEQPISELSGGNQQKVVIARWLTGEARIFIFDQPTSGVDVSAKVEIYRQMVQLARGGAGVIFVSSEFEELIGMCDRILVMSKNRIVREYVYGNVTEQELLACATSS